MAADLPVETTIVIVADVVYPTIAIRTITRATRHLALHPATVHPNMNCAIDAGAQRRWIPLPHRMTTGMQTNTALTTHPAPAHTTCATTGRISHASPRISGTLVATNQLPAKKSTMTTSKTMSA